MAGPEPKSQLSAANVRVAVFASLVVVGMLGMSAAAVPLYRVFCQVTGFGGTTQVADAEDLGRLEAGDRTIKVRFSGSTANDLPWRFSPVEHSVRIPVGERRLAFYEAENQSRDVIVGVASFNVTPSEAGKYFHKIACFCFEEQQLAPDETAQMPVSYYLDPALVDDPVMDDVHEITLHYSFFLSERRVEEAALQSTDTARSKGAKSG
ncbi:MAG: cytochrome c oxidase assembly protein [Pseudomonadota bacterium]